MLHQAGCLSGEDWERSSEAASVLPACPGQHPVQTHELARATLCLCTLVTQAAYVFYRRYKNKLVTSHGNIFPCLPPSLLRGD